jgi:hypothetical protein
MRGFTLITALILTVFMPFSVGAEQGWETMTGPEITQALSGTKLKYKTATQTFHASGKTLYNQSGRQSWGQWHVQQDKYCSTWPPQDLLACYHVERLGDKLRFVAVTDNGETVTGEIVK